MKVLKRIISIVIVTVMLLTVVSYAAVVTDNDASSFVTKAEFEAVKNNVQGQIDSYNNNLDNAIDGSIATYLSTVDIGGTSSAMIEKIKEKLNDGTLLGNFKLIGGSAPSIAMANGKIWTSTNQIKIEAGTSTTKTLTADSSGKLSWSGNTINMVDTAGTARDIQVKSAQGLSSSYDISVAGKGIVYEMFNAMWPVGTILVQSVKPGFGTWEEVTTANNRALWIMSGTTWGTTYGQQLPNITGTGKFTTGRQYGALANRSYTTSGSGAVGVSASDAASSEVGNIWGGSSSVYGKETVTINFNAASSDSTYVTGGVVRPNAYSVRLWKRTA